MEDKATLWACMDLPTVQLITMDLETIKELKDQAWLLYRKMDNCLDVVKMIDKEDEEFRELMTQEAQRPADEDE